MEQTEGYFVGAHSTFSDVWEEASLRFYYNRSFIKEMYKRMNIDLSNEGLNNIFLRVLTVEEKERK